MKIIRFPLGSMQANCYFLTEGTDCVIIDPADDAGFILEELQRRRLKLKAMLATHGHFDHVMAAGEIQASMSVPLYLNSLDSFLLKRTTETAEFFLGYKPALLPVKTILDLSGQKKLKISNFEFQIIPVPGHTPGSVCFYFPGEKTLFTGDTVFMGAVGRYDFSYSDKSELRNSLKKIFTLPDDTVILSGHGDKTTIAGEKNNALQMVI